MPENIEDVARGENVGGAYLPVLEGVTTPLELESGFDCEGAVEETEIGKGTRSYTRVVELLIIIIIIIIIIIHTITLVLSCPITINWMWC